MPSGLEEVLSATYSVAGPADENQHEADHQEDDSDCGQDGDRRENANQEKDEAENNQGKSNL